jgi:GDP-L-fucose synthase
MHKRSRIFVAGHNGLAGSALTRELIRRGYSELLLRSRRELDLRNREHVEYFFSIERPEYVFLAAARVGGILANSTRPAEFLYDNLTIQNNVIDAAARHGCRKLLFLGSSCIYPKLAPQPLKEEYLLTGLPEVTNEAYAIAKIAGIKMVQAYRRQYGFSGICLMPTNLYGPGDRFDLQASHVLPALMRKFHEAKEANASHVDVWGSGTPFREFLHADDLASACVFVMQHYDSEEILNVGSGEEIRISELASLLKMVTGFRGEIRFDPSKPDGTPRKFLDTSRLTALGWKPSISLARGIAETYAWYLNHIATPAEVLV